MTKSLWESSFFKVASGLAKALAKATSAEALSQELMLAGLVLASRSSLQDCPEELDETWTKAALAALKNAKFELPDVLPEPVSEKMPLNAALRELIKSADRDISALLKALVDAVGPVDWQSNAFLCSALCHVQIDLNGKGEPSVPAEVLAIGAFNAFEAGEFAAFPGLTGFFATNRAFFDALIAHNGASRLSQKADRLPDVVLVDDLLDALRDQPTAGSQFVAAVNVGLKAGAQLVHRRAVAYHEAGHAIVHHILRPQIATYKVTINPAEDYNGAFIPDKGSPLWGRWRRDDFTNEVCVCLAGRAAELIKFGFGELDTGAYSDLRRATELAWDHIVQLGLDPEFGPVSMPALAEAENGRFNWLADLAQQRLQIVLKEAEARTEKLLQEHWVKVEALVATLLSKGEVDLEEFIVALQSDGLRAVTGTRRAQSLPVERSVVFTKEPGSIETAEGTVRHDTGDAIVIGEAGERWPISRRSFEELYEPAAGQSTAEDGLYRKVQRQVLALQAADRTRVDLSHGRGVLLGGAGDWVVDYGDGDMAVVSGEVFARTYQLMDQEELAA